MKILDIYLEDDVICMKKEGCSTIIYLDNHIDNRNLLRQFNSLKSIKPLSNIENCFLEAEIDEMMNDYDDEMGYPY